MTDVVLHILGLGAADSTPKTGEQDLQHLTMPSFGHLLGANHSSGSTDLKHMRSSQVGQLTGIMEIKEDGNQEDQSELVSLDAEPHLVQDRSMQIDLKRRDKLVNSDRRRSSSLKPADLRVFSKRQGDVDAFLDINIGAGEVKKDNAKTSSPGKKQPAQNSLPFVKRFLNSTSPNLDK